MARVLLVEDDDKIGRLLSSALTSNGHEVLWQRTGASSIAAADQDAQDLVLLDLGLPDMDGIEVCRALKGRQPDAIVVMLTARRDEIDIVAGLESGADDYLVKPVRTTELLARLRAHLRRAAPRAPTTAPLLLGDLVIDLSARQCRLRNRDIALRSKEFDLLVRLAEASGTAVSRQQLMADVWDEHWVGSTKTLDVHVAAVRQRLAQAANAFEPPALVPTLTTLRGFGYRMDEPAT